MPVTKMVFKPGLNQENTRYTNEGGWWVCDKIRFRSGQPEKIGGWVPNGSNRFAGVARFLHNWRTLNANDCMGVGTHVKFYIEVGATYYDITPIRSTTTLGNNPFLTGTAGSPVVTVTQTAHGALSGDYVTFSGTTGTIDGIPAAHFNQEFAIDVVNANSYRITLDMNCSAGGVSGGGAAVVAKLQIGVGKISAPESTGYGASGYGEGGYGAPYVPDLYHQIRLWSAMNFGEDLVLSERNGAIYYWTAANGLTTRAVNMTTLGGASDVPTVAVGAIVTPEEFIIAYGANPVGTSTQDTLTVRWCSQASPNMWTATALNTAGDLRLLSGSKIVTGRVTRHETLLWTDASLHSMQYVGAPVVYSAATVAENISIIGPNAVATANNVTYWMGDGKFYVYDGSVRTLPCDLRKFIFNNLNISQGYQVYAGTNEQFNEVIWFYPSLSSSSIDSYVVFNYSDNVWYFGTMARTAWLDSKVRQNIIGTGYDGAMYYHDIGFDDGSTQPFSAIDAFIESADFDIGDGNQFTFMDRIIPDIDFDGSTAALPTALFTIKARNFPGQVFMQEDDRSVLRTTTVPIDQYTQQAWVRIRGRQMVFRIESNQVGVAWQAGTQRFSYRTDGKR